MPFNTQILFAFEKTILDLHTKILELFQKLDFPLKNQGLRNSLSLSFLEAVLLRQGDIFNQHIELINKHNTEFLVAAIQVANEKEGKDLQEIDIQMLDLLDFFTI